MKQTEITYENTGDGQIRIIDIKNVASGFEIERLPNGKEIFRLYDGGAPSYACLNSTDKMVIELRKEKGKFLRVVAGNVISRDKFEALIRTMKAAGKRFMDIKLEVAAREKKTIKI
jgi:glycosyltransferase involved in cell wall biosynthesis